MIVTSLVPALALYTVRVTLLILCSNIVFKLHMHGGNSWKEANNIFALLRDMSIVNILYVYSRKICILLYVPI